MNWADTVLLSILGLSTLIGVVRGFVSESLSVVVWVLAFWLSIKFGADAPALFERGAGTSPARLFLGYAGVFVAVMLIGGLVTWLIARMIRMSGLSSTDRMLGLLFGLARGIALCCVLVLLMGFTPLPQDPWWQQSRLLPTFERGALVIRGWLPDRVAPYLDYVPPPPSQPGTADVANVMDPNALMRALPSALPADLPRLLQGGTQGQANLRPEALLRQSLPHPAAAPAGDPARVRSTQGDPARVGPDRADPAQVGGN